MKKFSFWSPITTIGLFSIIFSYQTIKSICLILKSVHIFGTYISKLLSFGLSSKLTTNNISIISPSFTKVINSFKQLLSQNVFGSSLFLGSLVLCSFTTILAVINPTYPKQKTGAVASVRLSLESPVVS